MEADVFLHPRTLWSFLALVNLVPGTRYILSIFRPSPLYHFRVFYRYYVPCSYHFAIFYRYSAPRSHHFGLFYRYSAPRSCHFGIFYRYSAPRSYHSFTFWYTLSIFRRSLFHDFGVFYRYPPLALFINLVYFIDTPRLTLAILKYTSSIFLRSLFHNFGVFHRFPFRRSFLFFINLIYLVDIPCRSRVWKRTVPEPSGRRSRFLR